MIFERLPHLQHADEIAVPAVAIPADRDVELHPVVDLVGLRLPQVPGDIRGAQHRPREPPGERVLGTHHADVDRALLEDPILSQKLVHVVEARHELVHPGDDPFVETLGQIAIDAAEPIVVRVHSLAGDRLVELHQLLALLEHPQERRHRPDVERHGGDVEQMAEDAGDLVEQHPDVLCPDRHLDAEQLLDREHEAVLLHHRRDVLEPVEVGDALQVRADLDELLGAAMQEPDVRVGPLDHLAVHLQDEAEHTVRGRVLRAEVDCESALVDVGHGLPVQAWSSWARRVLGPRCDP